MSIKIKRIIDFLTAFSLLVLLAPVFLFVGMGVRLFLGAPVIFKQMRPGKDERIFEMVKFRTMTDATDTKGNLLSDTERLTGFGKFLRATSMDELPELWNVLKGEMSLVGPRPLLKKYLPFYSKSERKRHLVRPGITGWAQINGRNETNWNKRLELDVWYVENWSIWLDLKILLLTPIKVLIRSGVNTDPRLEQLDFDHQRAGECADD